MLFLCVCAELIIVSFGVSIKFSSVFLVFVEMLCFFLLFLLCLSFVSWVLLVCVCVCVDDVLLISLLCAFVFS